MPKWMCHFLYSKDLKSHLKTALFLAFVTRALSAFFVYGPQALDDYKHGVWPAYQHFAGLPLDLPAYRSHLLIWLLSGFVEVGSWLGVTSALGQVRSMYMGLGILSLSGVIGAYYFAKTVRSRIFGALSLYWLALFPLMPFVSTRAFGEAVALNLVVLAFGLLEFARKRSSDSKASWFFGFLGLGLATLFRFHVGVLYLSYMMILLVLRQWRGLLWACFAGLATCLAQALIDVLSGKSPFGTLIVYLAENEGGAAKYGVSPWYNPWLFVLSLSLIPFSFAIARNWRGLWRECFALLIPFLIFVLIHSIVAHKEERFLYPIVGIEFLMVSYLWASAALQKWARKLYSPVVLFVGLMGLPVVCLVNTQEGEIEPPAYVEKKFGKVTYLDHESLFGASRFQFYFLRPPSVLEKVEASEFNAHRVDEALKNHPEHRAVVMLTSHPEDEDQLRALEGASTMDSKCLELRTAGSIVDRALYSMNPKHNQRRRPTWYLICERSSG